MQNSDHRRSDLEVAAVGERGGEVRRSIDRMDGTGMDEEERREDRGRSEKNLGENEVEEEAFYREKNRFGCSRKDVEVLRLDGSFPNPSRRDRVAHSASCGCQKEEELRVDDLGRGGKGKGKVLLPELNPGNDRRDEANRRQQRQLEIEEREESSLGSEGRSFARVCRECF